MPTNLVRDNEKGNRDERLVAIVTPLYRFPLTPDEEISIRHLRQHLGHIDRYMIGPKKLPAEFGDFRLKRFPKRFFESIQSYNKLLVTKEFYRAFSNYEYILIYQTDCLVFSGNLEEWCRTGWDYVGAPWFKDFSSDPAGGMWAVGNGGLSLRKVSAALDVLTSTKWRMHDPKELGSQEPAFRAQYRNSDVFSFGLELFFSVRIPQQLALAVCGNSTRTHTRGLFLGVPSA